MIADSDVNYLKQIARTLLGAGYTLYLAQEGETAMDLIRAKKPAVVVVDVVLPKIYGFEIAEKVKSDPELSGTRVILLASVHEKDRFRRPPENLYGADAYIEKHHDGPAIVAKVRALLSAPDTVSPPSTDAARPAAAAASQPTPPSVPAPMPSPAPSPKPPQAAPSPPAPAGTPSQPTAPPASPPPGPAAPAASVVVAAKAPPAEAMPVPPDPDHQKAARLARTIIADIVLYNQELVKRGIQEGTLLQLLAKDLQDGLKYFNSQVSERIRKERDYFKEALEAMIAKKKKELEAAEVSEG